MKKFKRILSLILICTLVIPLVFGIAYTNAVADEATDMSVNNNLYQQDFSGTLDDLKSDGWSSSNIKYFHIDSAAGVLKSNQKKDTPYTGADMTEFAFLNMNASTEAANWRNYTAEATINLTYDLVDAVGAASKPGSVGLFVGTEAGTNGYKNSFGFMVTMAPNGSITYDLKQYDENQSATTRATSTTGNFSVGANKNNEVKVSVNTNKIQCYVNDVVVLEYEADDVSTIARGAIGLYAQRRICTYDDIKVTTDTWYWEDFSGTLDSLQADGWSSSNLKYFHVDSTAGVLKSNQTKDTPYTGADMTEFAFLNMNANTKAANWNNYTTEATINFLYDIVDVTGAGSKPGSVGLFVGTEAGTNGYKNSFGFMVTMAPNGTVTYDLKQYDENQSATTKATSTAGTFLIGANKNNKVKIVIDDDKIECYVNDDIVLTHEAQDVSDIAKGAIGLYVQRRICTFDDLTVRQTLTEEEPIDSSYLYVEDYSGTKEDLVTDGWDASHTKYFHISDEESLVSNEKADAADGTSACVGAFWCLSNHASAMTWKDYSVEADVTLTSTDVEGATGHAIAGLVAGHTGNSNAPKNGYWFFVQRNRFTGAVTYNLHQYDSSGTQKIELWSVEATDFEFDKTITMRVVLDGNRVGCFINGVLIHEPTEAEGVESITGSVGIYASGRVCKFDNLTVTSNYLYTENYDGTMEDVTVDGWDSTHAKYYHISDDKMLVSNQCADVTTGAEACKYYFWTMGGNADSKEWSNYIYQADVMLTSVDVDGATGHASVGLLAGHTGDSNRPKNGFWFFVQRNRFSGELTYNLHQYDENGVNRTTLWSVSADEFLLDEVYEMKMVLQGNQIACYMDDKLVHEATVIDGMDRIAGSIGMYASGKVATFDNLVVKDVTTELTMGADGDSGNQGGDSDYWYEQDFEDGMKAVLASGWNKKGKDAFSVKNGALMTSDERVNSTWFLNELTGATEWSNYTLEMDVTVTDQEVSGNTHYAGVFVAGFDGNHMGYEFCIVKQNGKYFCVLWDRTPEGKGKSLASATYGFSLNDAYSIKVAIEGNVLRCYIDDELMITHVVDGVDTLKGTIGIRQYGSVAIYDNIYVYPTLPSTGDDLIADVRGKKVWFSDKFNSLNTMMVERGWSREYSIESGKMLLTGLGSNYHVELDGIENAEKWTNYTAVTDIYISDDETATSSSYNPMHGVRVLSTSDKNGYDFGILLPGREEPGYLAVRSVATNTVIHKYTGIEFERGKTYQLAVSVNGNQFKCYVNGELLFHVTDEEYQEATGPIALYTYGYPTYYDNVMVYAGDIYHVDEQIDILSPTTGDMKQISLYVGIFVVAGISVVGCSIYRKRRNE